jgi:hypothetical protein
MKLIIKNRLIFFIIIFTQKEIISQIKNMDVPFSEYSYVSSNCNGFAHQSGTLIFIPENAFVREDGKDCNGKITIKYRELVNQTDILVSGINMIYVKNGRRILLESAGMFEIKAECNGTPLKIKPDKEIQVRMNCVNDLKNLSSYIYNFEKNYWEDANLPISDFTFKNNSNNKDDVNLWGASSVKSTAQNSNNEDMMSDSARTAFLNNVVGKLPDGYIKGLNIKKTGLYNYDAIIKDENAVQIIAKFKLSTREDVNDKIYVAYPKKNMLVYYTPEDMNERFYLLPVKGLKIFSVLKDGSVAIIKEEEITQTAIKNLKGKEHTFILEKQTEKPKDRNTLAKAVNIQ